MEGSRVKVPEEGGTSDLKISSSRRLRWDINGTDKDCNFRPFGERSEV